MTRATTPQPSRWRTRLFAPWAAALAAVLAAGLLSAAPAAATVQSFSGNFAADDDLFVLAFDLAQAGAVQARTLSYGGGANAAGSAIGAGGFDPVLSLFDATGLLIALNQDDGSGSVAADPATGFAWDALLSLSLNAGHYTLVLSQGDNLPFGPSFSDGFAQAGNGSFTGDMVGVPGGRFFDIAGNSRTSFWALDLSLPNRVPEPGALALCALGLLALRTGRRNT